ncbi:MULTISPECIES: hypothetical protein [Thermomonospora]|uniref:Uncharacterized protein n=1 Tax=Thermomonospora cellulosilytica TaxID=1411118 RepID=A0A7W3R8E8_9ACTN|nr:MULTISPECIES: hypothetical protein [Thermomonospora]MBA9004258.1 hypothetical protein [Thermomonospora cellulosilytica]
MSGWNPPPGQGGGPYGPQGPGQQPGYGPAPGGGPVPPYGGQPQPPYGGAPQPPPYGGAPQPPGYGPQPGPVGPGTPPPFPPPAPPKRGSGAGVILLLGGGGLVVVLILVAVVIALGGGSDHTISTPPTAGGLSRNTAAESELNSQISQQRSMLQRSAGYRLDDVKTAVYGEGRNRWLFLGGTGNIEDPDDFVEGFRRSATSTNSGSIQTTVNELSDAGGDGVGVCAEIRSTVGSTSYTTALCSWATDSSFGAVYPAPEQASSLTDVPTFSASDVADMMRRIRADVED